MKRSFVRLNGPVCFLVTKISLCKILLLYCMFNSLEMKIAEFANSVDLDEVAHNEPPHLDLHCLPSSV